MAEESDAAFRVQYHDTVYNSHSEYILSFYSRTNEVSMYDVARKRMFLRRSYVPEEPSLNDCYVGATVVVCGRALKVLDFADEHTRRKFANTRGASLIVVKPHMYKHAGEILDHITHYQQGHALKVGRVRTVHFSQEQAQEFLAIGKGAAVSGADAAQLASGTSLCIEVAGDDVIAVVHEVVGPADPTDAQAAAPASIRARFGSSRAQNAVHSSLSIDVAKEELKYVLENPSLGPTAVFNRCAVVLVKPHAVTRGLTGHIMSELVSAGMDITGVRSVVLNRADAADFLEHYRTVYHEFEKWVGEVSSGPCVAVEARPAGCDTDDAVQASAAAVDTVRALAGPFDPAIAKALRPSTWRARWGEDTVANIVHVTDLPRDGPLEARFLFSVVDSK